MAFVAAEPMLWASIASTAMSVMSAISQGQQQSDQSKAAAKAQEYNAAVARARAANATAVYGQKEEQQRRQARIAIGEQRAAGAQSGLGLSGSSLDIESQSLMNAELDSMNIRYQGSLESSGLLSQANMSDYSASNYKIAADNASTNGYLGAGAALLSGAAKYNQLKAGIPGTTSRVPTFDGE